MNLEKSTIGYCIRCGEKIEFNPKYPYCSICGGVCSACNRFSGIDDSTPYCHLCGEPVYVEEKNPVCDLCKKKITP